MEKQPDIDRAMEIVAPLRIGEPSFDDVSEAFWLLDELPPDVVREAVASWLGPLPDPERLDAATRLAHGMPPRPLHLRTLSVAKDADVLDLGPVAEAQLVLAGKSWDGVDRAPEERLDGEIEGSFAGTLERHVLHDADVPGDAPLFEVLLFHEDAGVVFHAGTTKIVALIAYRKVELRDRRTRMAIEQALAATRAEIEPLSEQVVLETLPEEVKPTRKTTPKRTPTVKTATKKPATKKVASKAVPAAKRMAAKKAATKKTAAKKAATKKTAAKKAATKKLAAKKTAPKKTAKKKSAASKAKRSKPR